MNENRIIGVDMAEREGEYSAVITGYWRDGVMYIDDSYVSKRAEMINCFLSSLVPHRN